MATDVPLDPFDWVRTMMQMYAGAWKTAMQVQEQSLRWWSELMGAAGQSAVWQRRLSDLAAQASTTMKRNAEFYASAMDTHRKGLEVLNRTLSNHGRSLQQLQGPVQEAWENAFAAMRSSTEALVQANTRAVRSWAQKVVQTPGR